MVLPQLKQKVVNYPDNKIQQIGYFNNQNKKDSCWTSYFEDGSVSSKAYYFNGIKNGIWFVYNKKGNKLFELHYFDGTLILGKNWNENGDLIEERKNN
jgi:antitoxin component YwqK of YwqJK toxin-antitoxin module